jgi:hypothetical protein
MSSEKVALEPWPSQEEVGTHQPGLTEHICNQTVNSKMPES